MVITWNGKTYETKAEAARANGLTYGQLHSRLRKGYTCDADVKPNTKLGKPCVWNGKRYKSVADAARDKYVSKVGMLYRLQKGYTCDSDLRGAS